MNLERFALAYAGTFALIVARLAGFVVISPFPGANVDKTARIGLVVVLAWVVTSFAHPAEAMPPLDMRLGIAVVSELGCGLVIGLGFHLLYMVAEIAGQAISQAIGFSQAATLNPTLGTQDMILSRAISLFAMLFALAAGVHRAALGILLASFRALPVGTQLEFAPTAMKLIDLSISSFTLGIGLALPLIAVAFVVQLGLAMIARAAPSLQIFSVGWGVLLASGSVILLSSLHDLVAGMSTRMGALPAELDGLLVALAGRN